MGGDDFSRGSDVVLHAVVDPGRVATGNRMSSHDQMRHELASLGYDEHGGR